MKVYRELDDKIFSGRRGVALGTFDGIHLGHQSIIHELTSEARESGNIPAVFTFADHPDLVFGRGKDFQGLIMSPEEKLSLLSDLGVQEVFLLPFAPAIYELSAEQFLQKCLQEKLKARFVVLGEDARFGQGRKGDVKFLQAWGQKNEIAISVIKDVHIAGIKVSSTAIRNFLSAGQMEEASLLLGRNFSLRLKDSKAAPEKNVQLEFISMLDDKALAAGKKEENDSWLEFSYPEAIVPVKTGRYKALIRFDLAENSVPAELEIKRLGQELLIRVLSV